MIMPEYEEIVLNGVLVSSQATGQAKMASKDVELTGKDNPNNAMNDKREYEVEECVPTLHLMYLRLSGWKGSLAKVVRNQQHGA